MANQENYTLNVNKVFDEVGGQRSENHSYTASNAADLKYMLQLAGVVDYNQEEEMPCGCAGPCECGNGDLSADGVPVTVAVDDGAADMQTPYDYGDDFQPHFAMNDWEANSYEQFVKTPSQNWPTVFEGLKSELTDRGLSVKEAEEKIFNLLDLGINEHFDYGHGNPLDNQTTVSIKGMNIDRGSIRKFKQDYVQARYGDNPLSANNEISETIEQKYQRFLKESILLEKENQLENHRLPVGSAFIAGLPTNGDVQIHVIVKSDKEPTERAGKMDITYEVKMMHVMADGKIKKTENVKKWGSQLNRPSTGGKVYVGKYLGKVSNPSSVHPDLSGLKLKKLRESVMESQSSYTSKENSKGERVSLNKKKNDDGEYIVKCFKRGKMYEDGCYYTDDWDDAVGTFEKMKKDVEKIDESKKKVSEGDDTFQFKRAVQLAADDYVKNFGDVPNLLNFRMREYAKSIAAKFGKDEMMIRKELERLITKKKSVTETALMELNAADLTPAQKDRLKQLLVIAKDLRVEAKAVETVTDQTKQRILARMAKEELTSMFQILNSIGAGNLQEKVREMIKSTNQAIKNEYEGNYANVLVNFLYDEIMSPIHRAVNEQRSAVDEAGQRLDPSCWDGYKIGKPKTKISPQTGKRVNNCVPK